MQLRLLESLRSADGLELVRGVAERMLQELIEAEATARIGAEWNEHTDTRTALRNGHRLTNGSDHAIVATFGAVSRLSHRARGLQASSYRAPMSFPRCAGLYA
ncbi:transposase [Streptomyces cynarae]|uniref:Transposase n=1 Tax=Streptomyces cynarae TaxID=2981134 RepID=A0ABY6EEY1_9ACTN|nr:transposase [Streptomyces cynarae]UXY24326.1 transposase [Streptomyces cynarae]